MKLVTEYGYRFPGFMLALVAVAIAVVATLSYSSMHNSFSLTAIFFCSLIVGFLGSTLISGPDQRSRSYAARLFIFCYSINVIFVYVFSAYFTSKTGMPFIPEIGHRNPDDLKYHTVGIELAKQWYGGLGAPIGDPALEFKYKGYAYLNAALYYVFGYFGEMNPLIPRIVNSMFGGMLMVLIFRIGFIVYGARVAYLAALIAIFFPVWNYYSSMGLRDIIVAYLICLFTYHILRITEAGFSNIPSLIGVVVALIGLYYFRTPVVWVALLAAALYFVLAIKDSFIKASVIFIGAMLYIGALFYGWVPGKEVLAAMVDQAERWGGGRDSVVTTESLAIRYIYQAPTLLYIPLIALYTAVMPVPPIQGFMMHHFFVGVGALTWYFYVPFWVHAMIASLRYSKATLLTLLTFFLFVGIAVIQPDIRHKTQFFGLAMVQIAYSLLKLRDQRVTIIAGVGILGAILGALYITLKF